SHVRRELHSFPTRRSSDLPVEAFKSDYAEIRADINKARGNIEAARAGYEEALAATDPQQQERMMLLQLKRDDLKAPATVTQQARSEEHTSELQSRENLVCR